MDEIPNFDNMQQQKENPLYSVVKKIEERGHTLKQLFVLLDDNDDNILTLNEVSTGFKSLGINLTS